MLPIVLAKMEGPGSFSTLLPVIIIIQFSSFLSSVGGAVYLKSVFSNSQSDSGALFYTLACIPLLLIVVLYTEKSEYILILAFFIGLGNLFRGYYQNQLRAHDKITQLSNFNLIYPIFLLVQFIVIFFLDLVSVESFIFIQFVTFCFIFLFIISKGSFNFKSGYKEVKSRISVYIMYFFMNLSAYLLLQSDKFFLSNIDDKSFKGGYLFLDSLTNIFYMLFSSISYILYPKLLKLFKEKSGDVIRLTLLWVSFLLMFLGAFYFIALLFTKYFYSEYFEYYFMMGYIVAIKFLVLSLNIPTAFYISRNKENVLVLFQSVVSVAVITMFFVSSDLVIYLYSIAFIILAQFFALVVFGRRYDQVLP